MTIEFPLKPEDCTIKVEDREIKQELFDRIIERTKEILEYNQQLSEKNKKIALKYINKSTLKKDVESSWFTKLVNTNNLQETETAEEELAQTLANGAILKTKS